RAASAPGPQGLTLGRGGERRVLAGRPLGRGDRPDRVGGRGGGGDDGGTAALALRRVQPLLLRRGGRLEVQFTQQREVIRPDARQSLDAPYRELVGVEHMIE